MNKEFMGSELTKWSFKFPSFRILDEGIFINPISPFKFEVKPTSE